MTQAEQPCKNRDVDLSNRIRTVEKEVLPNGLVVITEPMEHVRSVSVGIWLRSGLVGSLPS